MKSTAGALAFLVARTTRNRLARQVARLKSPRYAIAAAVGLLYFWGVFARPGVRSQSPSPTLGTVGGIGLAITVLTWWLSGGVTGALAFQPAEVQLLFPAPVSRRMLLGYKVARSQLLLLLSCVLWTLLTRSWGVTLSWPLRFATLWGFFSILSLHRLGAALVMAPPVSAGRRVATVAGKALAAAAAAALVAGVAPVILRFGSLGFPGGIRALGAALAAPPAGYALAPFRVVTAPLYAATPDAWLRGFASVVGVILEARLVFHVPLRGSLPLLLVEGLLFILVSLSLGILISARTSSQRVAMLSALVGTMLPTMLLSGFIFPLESMPWPLRAISVVVPARWFVLVARSIMLKGVGISYLWRPSLVLLVMAVVLLAASTRAFHERLEG